MDFSTFSCQGICEENATKRGYFGVNFPCVSRKYPSLPSHEETAEKLTKFFFRSDHGPRKLVKRQALATFFDIMYILDSSSSVSDWEFQRAVQAIQTMVAKSKRDNRHAVITIATRAKTFMNFSSRADAVRKLRGISRSGGKTNTQDALELAFQMFTTSKYGSTPGGLARVLVVTDGRSNMKNIALRGRLSS
ncbi:predicted protein [Nematostella vectensis]|uniref:VWFA domain-containing protein n=1 Tax=Nematostella vectensis TaxID=45351 RepID=A7SXX2_NEMVE|nr:predicted protein [Nematostella vectensis]|eukprot:XP_001623553.1 predicted protein [Nematostella vectensis]